MRTNRRLAAAITALLLAGVSATAQVPAAPPAAIPPLPGVAPPAPLPGTPLPAAAAPAANLWSFLCKTPEQKAAKKARFCNSRLGQFINASLLPLGAATGGLLGPCCPGPNGVNPADLAKPATSAEGAAARIKAEEAQAKAKIAAIEYLATVDCRYYPEAEAALINGLRAEKNECVRLAAAKAFATGCCCSAKVLKALTISVNCSNKDGLPAEASELVRAYAFVALERCLLKCTDGPGAGEAPPEQPPEVKQAVYDSLRKGASTAGELDVDREILLAAYFKPGGADAAAYAEARRVLAQGITLTPQTVARMTSSAKNLYSLAVPPGTTPADLLPDIKGPKLPSMANVSVFPLGKKLLDAARVPLAGPAVAQGVLTRPAGVVPPPVTPAAGVSAQPPAGADAAQPATAHPTGRRNLFTIISDARKGN